MKIPQPQAHQRSASNPAAVDTKDERCVAVLSIWNDVDPEIEHEYEAWYQRDHLRDRVGTPGFKSCRRYERILGDGRRYFTFSDLESVDVIKADAYAERLRNPTEWTRRIMPHFRNLIRVVADVNIDRGDGTGGYAATALYEAPETHLRASTRAAIDAAIDHVMADPRITRVRVFESNAGTNNLPNPEAALRPDPQQSTGLAIVIEGSCQSSVCRHLEGLRQLPELAALAPAMPASVYRLLFSSRS